MLTSDQIEHGIAVCLTSKDLNGLKRIHKHLRNEILSNTKHAEYFRLAAIEMNLSWLVRIIEDYEERGREFMLADSKLGDPKP